jgi:threonine synthase
VASTRSVKALFPTPLALSTSTIRLFGTGRAISVRKVESSSTLFTNRFEATMDNHQLSALAPPGGGRGSTPLVEAPLLAACLRIGRLYLKLEGATPTGNHKHHLAAVAGAAYAASGASGVAVASCGHLGVSMAAVCAALGVPCRVFLVDGCPLDMAGYGVAVETGHATYEEAVAACAEWAGRHRWLNATPGYDLASLYRAAFGRVAGEVTAVLGTIPDAVVCPVGNGTTLAGVFGGFEALGGIRLPRHYGATIHDNALAGTPLQQRVPDWELEPLRACAPLDALAASRATAMSGGRFVALDRARIRRAAQEVRWWASLDCHPASAAAVAAVRTLRARGEIGSTESVLAVLTTLHDVPARATALPG